jgi:hypothetical protein
MTQNEAVVSDVPGPRLLRRIWFPLTSVGLVAVLLAGVWIAQVDGLDRGLKVTLSAIFTAIAIALVLAWFFFFLGAGLVDAMDRHGNRGTDHGRRGSGPAAR